MKRGRDLGFPANVAPPMYSAIPADGCVRAWFTRPRPGPVRTGRTGTAVPGRGVNRHQPDVLRAHPYRPRHSCWTAPLTFTVSTWPSTVSRIRGMEPFADVDALIAEMNRDVEKTRVILGTKSPDLGRRSERW